MQFRRNLIDEKIDVYSLGNIFYKLMTNKPKYNELSPLDAIDLVLSGDIPQVDDIVHPTVTILKKAMKMCLAFDPRERKKAADIADFLEKALESFQG